MEQTPDLAIAANHRPRFPMINISDKIRAGLWGVLVADAIGVPHEFKNALTIKAAGTIEMSMPGYDKTYPKVPYGTWSDDGSLTLALADSLARSGCLDTMDFGQSVVNWFTKAAYTPDKKTFDVGNTTQEAILRMMRGHEPRIAGLTQENANGNGSLMRTLPMGLFHRGSDEELYQDACEQSAVTHGHDISKACCGVYSVAARHLLNGESPEKAFIMGLKLAHVKLPFPPAPQGTGYVLDSLAFAIQAVRSRDSYEKIVRDAIRLGNDTDTTAAIAGGLVAVRDGMTAIPPQWLHSLRGRDVATPIIEAFVVARVGS